MLRERRELLEREVEKQRTVCSTLYRKTIQDDAGNHLHYDVELGKLEVLMEELTTISQMIEDDFKY